MGGLSKKAYQLEKIQKEHQLPHLTLDAGNLLFKQQKPAPGLLLQAKITASGIIEAYNQMNYDAAAVGTYDLAAGLEFLKEKSRDSEFTWLSANLVNKSSGKPFFTPSITRRVGNITVGIIGLTAPVNTFSPPEEENVGLLPWKEVLPQIVADLSNRCDLIILLSNNTTDLNLEIAEAFPDIHVILESTPHPRNMAPQQKNNSLLAKTGQKGKYLGWMLVNWQKSRTWGRDGAVKELALKKQELDGVTGRISRLERRTDEEELAENTSYQQLVNTREQLLSEIIFLENELYTLRESGQVPATFENHFVVLDANLPDQPEVGKIVNLTKEKVNLAGKDQAAEGERIRNRSELALDKLLFGGWRSCQTCHKTQTDFWLRTDHASAYQSLVEQDQQFNLECLPCHVTAEYKDVKISPDEAVLLSLPATLRGVGCEVCHGPGRSHVATQNYSDIDRKPDISICTRCHTPERDENFNYQNDAAIIACPADNPAGE